ncbi:MULTISPECIES: NUDIX domain-containing protein [Vitreoscilla]|uniref:8-oxo-dGTP diphosphatase n=1 Tax=Vitreoscilla stercoraria TaxID=61 RepID=A0ABY4E9W6_VITST|nr:MULTISPECIES: NUDIX domain-containing protein [Vitreoscilla]AUZ03974.1 NUDIX family hydrolase [Vitreoscilla sp. C1]UOO92106.1 NUDIX domain-containing protein [Vitreoscilla stercoraria]
MSVKLTHVVAAVILNERGEFLLSSRPEGKAYAGFWEFAGGKVEAGETELAALQRELHEELGIQIAAATPWLTKTYRYEHAHVYLRFFRVLPQQWQGEIQCREQQQYSWQQAGRFDVEPMLPANGPILRALSLPWLLKGRPESGWRGQNGVGEVWMAFDVAADVVLHTNMHLPTVQTETLHLLPWSVSAQECAGDGWWWRPVALSDIETLCVQLRKRPVDMPMVVLLDEHLMNQASILQDLGVHVAVTMAEDTA